MLNNKTNRLSLIKDIADNEFNGESDVVLLNCSKYPIIAKRQNNLDQNVFPDFRAFLKTRLMANDGSLDKLIKELGFDDAQSAIDFMYTVIKDPNSASFYALLARAYDAVYLKDIRKIAILTSSKSLDDIDALAQLIKKRDANALDRANGLLFYLVYRININRPLAYDKVVSLLKE